MTQQPYSAMDHTTDRAIGELCAVAMERADAALGWSRGTASVGVQRLPDGSWRAYVARGVGAPCQTLAAGDAPLAAPLAALARLIDALDVACHASPRKAAT